ncbi:MAG TPA: ATP-binding cassette domain-containing protein [Anaerolineae bacterium]|nr:ATP-binding cassette domain-containing protein [Anaerolineae bacterium]
MIEVENLTKYYGDLAAIRDLNFRVERGEILGFLGPNGAGKTTTMRILSGYMPPSAGTARVADFDVFDDSLEVRRRIGYMPETVPLYPEMSVRSYLAFMARIRGVSNRKEQVDAAMEACHIADKAGTIIGKLSKGYRQRVGLAQALVHDPEVLILDEPTIGLDPKQIIEVRELIKELGHERTIILSTHILSEAQQTCDRVLIINEGEIVAEGTSQQLTDRLTRGTLLHVQVAQPGPEVIEVLSRVPGVTGVEPEDGGSYGVTCAQGQDCRTAIAATVVNGGWGLLELRAIEMSLEDIFLRLTSEEAATPVLDEQTEQTVEGR